MTPSNYLESEFERVKKIYKSDKHRVFGGRNQLAKWFVETGQKQDWKCCYCDTSIHDINKLINAGLLKTRKTKGEGKRGPTLEIDKNDDDYQVENCVLACYYCNNDKSYTSTKEEYIKYFGPNRGKYFSLLLANTFN